MDGLYRKVRFEFELKSKLSILTVQRQFMSFLGEYELGSMPFPKPVSSV